MDMSYFDNDKNKGLKIAIASLKTIVRILVLAFVVLAIIYIARKVYNLGFESFSAKPIAEREDEAETVTVVIKKNMSLREIADLLNEKGLIDESEEAFLIQANAYGYAKSIIPGSYELNTSMTVEEMLELMSTEEEEEEEE